jgi:hypothetical protein
MGRWGGTAGEPGEGQWSFRGDGSRQGGLAGRRFNAELTVG